MTDAMLGELTDVFNGLHAPERFWQGSLQTLVFPQPLMVQFLGTDQIGLSPELWQCLQTFLKKPEHHKTVALSALLEFYRKDILPMWHQNHYFGVPELADQIVPEVQNLAEFEALLTYPRLSLHSQFSWGLEFECTWDVEHGAGVLVVDGQVVTAGLAEVAAL